MGFLTAMLFGCTLEIDHSVNFPNKNLTPLRKNFVAFNLADKGYDVWLGTLRGSHFAQTHKRYNISSRNYWDFKYFQFN